MLRIFSFWPILLILVWSLSPVGGQGALRAMDLKQNTTTMEYHLSSYPKNNLSVFANTLFNNHDSFGATNQYQALRSAVFSAQDISLLQTNGSSNGFSRAVQNAGGASEAVRVTKRDLWRNVRVPFLHRLPKYDKDTIDWIGVPSDIVLDYSSLIGVPIRGYPSIKAANTSFVIQTNYHTLEVRRVAAHTLWMHR
jgi:hypothetical protein